MQVKIFTIPILGGEKLTDDLNVFLRSKKILHVERQMIAAPQGAFWSFCIDYIDDNATYDKDKPKIDYREVLDEATFKRFSKMREYRKQFAQEDGVPPYAVFTDEELAGVAKLEKLTVATIKGIKGIGEKKAEKYAQRFITAMTNE